VEPSGDFERDTAVTGGDGRYGATLVRAWELWGPAGGYVSAIALRAAGKHSRFDRPVSIACNYLGVAEFGPIEIAVETVNSAKRSEVIRVDLIQNGRTFLDATVWTIDREMAGLSHDVIPIPEVPPPEDLKAWIDVSDQSRNPYRHFWSNLEERLLEQWFGLWRDRTPGAPERAGWIRFRPKATFDDPFLDAARSVMIVDVMGWPAAMMAYNDDREFVAPTIELSVRFHRLAQDSEWLFYRAETPIATDGLAAGTATIWDRDGRLVASGGQTMLFRPVRP
jgi:acyl-CoA thioesterase II